jgi:hypothetical protein
MQYRPVQCEEVIGKRYLVSHLIQAAGDSLVPVLRANGKDGHEQVRGVPGLLDRLETGVVAAPERLGEVLLQVVVLVQVRARAGSERLHLQAPLVHRLGGLLRDLDGRAVDVRGADGDVDEGRAPRRVRGGRGDRAGGDGTASDEEATATKRERNEEVSEVVEQRALGIAGEVAGGDQTRGGVAVDTDDLSRRERQSCATAAKI